MIKTSKHTTKFCNSGKLEFICEFIEECRRVCGIYINHIWENGYKWIDKYGKQQEFSVSKNLLRIPSYLDYNIIQVATFLSARSLRCLTTQVSGMIRSATESQRKRLYVFNDKKNKGASKKELANLIKNIKIGIPHKPNHLNVNLELNSICCDFEPLSKEFDGFICLHSIRKDGKEVKIPIKFNMHVHRLKKKGYQIKTSILLKKDIVNVRWEIEDPPAKTNGIVVGCDQGLKDVLTISDGITTPKTNKHGQSVESVIQKLCKKTKGSKAAKKAKEQLKNVVNWSINQIDLSNYKQINFEKIYNFGHGQKLPKILRYWPTMIIRDKLMDKAKEEGVQFKFQSSACRSQRCSCCGLVRKANRNGKRYFCPSCGLEIDADLNAALNHEIELPEVPWILLERKLNRKGFYWTTDGFFNLDGSELTVLGFQN